MAKNAVTKEITDFNVSIYDNGFTVTYSGRDDNDDWTDAKLIVPSVEELHKVIDDVVGLARG